ncbi:uncharacterized protein LOC117295609 [Asterias rubens]|uniref:uncharacterized protein LOC117295609 n=1 Tax=Asterias rubens TaxID=7604 RepID=UPI0014556746|nr:uncharacterized protein LOC117295609 [Asterias rubens]
MSKQSNLEEFAKTKSPVKLKNVAVEDQTLIVKRQTQIVKLPVLNFHYDAKTTKTYTIADLLKDSPLDKTLVDIKLAKVLHIHPAVLKTIPYTNREKESNTSDNW